MGIRDTIAQAPPVDPTKRPTSTGGLAPPKKSAATTGGGTPAFGSETPDPGAGVPFWDDDPDAWDTLTIGGVTVPGICNVSVNKRRDLDVKKANGSDGVTTTDTGYGGAKVKITWKLWTADQWRDRRRVLRLIDPAPGKLKDSAVAWTVGHPVFADRGISAIQIDSIDGPEGEGDGSRTYTINAVEFRPPPKKIATGTPTSASGAGQQGRDKDAAIAAAQKAHEKNPPSGFKYTEDGNMYNEKTGAYIIGDTL